MWYDVCVVGAGTMGSSTAYHLSKNKNLKTCLIGPGEPETKTPSRQVFGCHYDEGRITRTISQIETEQVLAYRSMLEYPELERESGLQVFWEVGFAVLGETGDVFVEEFNEMADRFCEREGLVCEKVEESFVKERWGFFVPPHNVFGRYSKKYNGFISVRNLVRACQIVAVKNGVMRNTSIVKNVTKVGDNFEIALENGDIFVSKKVVIACGSFTNFFNVLPNKRQLDLSLIGHTVLKFELSEADAEIMTDFPSMVYKPNHHSPYVYILPPILYPNGKTYIKFGHVVYIDKDIDEIGQRLSTLSELQQWYCQEDYPKARQFLRKHFANIFPDVKALGDELDFCVMALTSSGKQLIGFAEDDLFVAGGGNGKSAKFGLEIGRICSDSIVKGEWDYDLNQDDFKLRYKDEF